MIFLVSKNNDWSQTLYKKLSIRHDCLFYDDDSYMCAAQRQKPDWIFFLHWSKIVPSHIHQKYSCVVIHTGNLPQNRGGSPIQNQILEGIVKTKVNALQMSDEVDAGDIYCSAPMTLQGDLTDIWRTIADLSYDLICKCISGDYTLQKQLGMKQVYKRRKDNEILFDKAEDLIQIYNQIRMLDAEQYPSAQLNFKNYKLEFNRAKFNGKEIIADVKITRT